MFQLIYTSAPRLLSAGKTGFGTVACSRDMPPPLVAYLERISTFDRAAAVNALQFYTVYTMGAAVFHVFSRVADCGADYTGRTNHLAQHFVIEEDGPEFTALLGSTPAGMMIVLNGLWISSWDMPPTRLDETPLPGFAQQMPFEQWATMTGNADNARWLNNSGVAEGCCLCLPPATGDAEALRLIHDGMLTRPEHGWGISFCTSISSNLNGITIRCLTDQQQAANISYGHDVPLNIDKALTPPPPDLPIPSEAPAVVELQVTEVGGKPRPPKPDLPLPTIVGQAPPPLQVAPHKKRRDYDNSAPVEKKQQATSLNMPAIIIGGIAVLLLGIYIGTSTNKKDEPAPGQNEPNKPKITYPTPDTAQPDSPKTDKNQKSPKQDKPGEQPNKPEPPLPNKPNEAQPKPDTQEPTAAPPSVVTPTKPTPPIPDLPINFPPHRQDPNTDKPSQAPDTPQPKTDQTDSVDFLKRVIHGDEASGSKPSELKKDSSKEPSQTPYILEPNAPDGEPSDNAKESKKPWTVVENNKIIEFSIRYQELWDKFNISEKELAEGFYFIVSDEARKRLNWETNEHEISTNTSEDKFKVTADKGKTWIIEINRESNEFKLTLKEKECAESWLIEKLRKAIKDEEKQRDNEISKREKDINKDKETNNKEIERLNTRINIIKDCQEAKRLKDQVRQFEEKNKKLDRKLENKKEELRNSFKKHIAPLDKKLKSLEKKRRELVEKNR